MATLGRAPERDGGFQVGKTRLVRLHESDCKSRLGRERRPVVALSHLAGSAPKGGAVGPKAGAWPDRIGDVLVRDPFDPFGYIRKNRQDGLLVGESRGMLRP